MNAATILGAIGLGLTLIGLLITDILTRRRELILRLVDRRQAAYQQFMTDMTTLINNTIANPNAPPAQTGIDAMRAFNNSSFLVSDDRVVRSWLNFQSPTTDPQERLRRWARLMVAMRRDMGNARTKLRPSEALKTIIKPEDWAEVDRWFANADH
jgi:hypothetical protein